MSNIFYKEKKLAGSETEPVSGLGVFNMFKKKAPSYQTPFITLENVKKFFKADLSGTMGLGINKDIYPLNIMSWELSEKYYEHKELGKVFLPKNIHLTDGKKDYFIVLMDDAIELRYWPGFRVNPKLSIDHRAVVSEEEIKLMEKSFMHAFEHLGANKTFEERYQKVKGVNIKQEHFIRLLGLLISDEQLIYSLAKKLHEAASDPVAYFKHNEEYCYSIDVEEPSKNLYVWLLIAELQNRKKCFSLGWKAPAKELNAVISVLSGHRINAVLDETDNRKTADMLTAANQKLEEHGLSLLNINTHSDSYSLLLVEKETMKTIEQAAKTCKIDIGF